MNSSYLLLNDQLRCHYYNANLSGRRPLLLLHGLASNARIWHKLAPYLVQADLALYAPDLRGHGLSDKPDDYGFGAIARDLVALVEACDLRRPILVGHSWGAMLALDYAARFPIGPRSPAALVLVDGGIMQLDDEPGADWETVSARLTPPRLDGMPLSDFMQFLQTFNPVWQPDEQDIEIIMGNFWVDEDEKIHPNLAFERHMQIVRAIWEFHTYERFTRLRCPVLAVPARPALPHSEPAAAFLALKERGLERCAAAQPNLQVHWLADSIHDLPLQRPAELAAALLAFLPQ